MQTAHERATAIAAAARLGNLLRSAWRGETVEGTGDLIAALLDSARALDNGGIVYAVIGGFAVGMHATPRATIDVDVAIPTKDREQAFSVMRDAGFSLRGTHPHSDNLMHPNGAPVQRTFDAYLDPMIGRAEVVEVGGVQVRVLACADLIASKERAANDPARRRSEAIQDLADLERLRGDDPDPEEGW